LSSYRLEAAEVEGKRRLSQRIRALGAPGTAGNPSANGSAAFATGCRLARLRRGRMLAPAGIVGGLRVISLRDCPQFRAPHRGRLGRAG
jgi:hypothetical protein